MDSALRDIEPVRAKSLSDQVYEALFRRIISGGLAAGKALPSEESLCKSFEVSRPVVREALRRLRKDGAIESRKGSGSYVARSAGVPAPSTDVPGRIESLLQGLEFRRSIEPNASYYASLRRSPDQLAAIAACLELQRQQLHGDAPEYRTDFAFHLAVAAASGNPHYEAALRVVEDQIDFGVSLARFLGGLGHTDREPQILREHEAILDAIRIQDPNAARQAMLVHLDHAQIRMISA